MYKRGKTLADWEAAATFGKDKELVKCNHTFKFIGYEGGKLKYGCVKCPHIAYEKE